MPEIFCCKFLPCQDSADSARIHWPWPRGHPWPGVVWQDPNPSQPIQLHWKQCFLQFSYGETPLWLSQYRCCYTMTHMVGARCNPSSVLSSCYGVRYKMVKPTQNTIWGAHVCVSHRSNRLGNTTGHRPPGPDFHTSHRIRHPLAMTHAVAPTTRRFQDTAGGHLYMVALSLGFWVWIYGLPQTLFHSTLFHLHPDEVHMTRLTFFSLTLSAF